MNGQRLPPPLACLSDDLGARHYLAPNAAWMFFGRSGGADQRSACGGDCADR